MASVSTKRKRKNAAGNRSDPGWEHGIEVNKALKRVQCKHCKKVYSGGVFRLKHHLAGTHIDAEPCLQAPNDVKEKMRALLQSYEEEAEKRRRMVNDIGDDIEEEASYEMPRRKGKGIMDSFVSNTNPKKQTTLNQLYKKEERDEVCQQVARFFYTSAIPFNVVNNPEFPLMCEKIAKFGIGFKPPSYHEVRVKLLKKEVTSVVKLLEEHKDEWRRTGCTIMSDGWTDKQRRTICNFLVNSPKGSVFLTSLDTSDISKTADKVFEMLDRVVEEVGEENVVQVVTDNAANYKAAGEKLMEKRKRLFWTPCAAHCIDLMLEDFDKKLKVHSVTISKAKRITTFIYSRTLVHTWLKEFTKGRELIRPGMTRFATSYLTLRSLNEQRSPLLAMFSSNKWSSSRFASTAEGKRVQRIVLDTRGFWAGVTTCLKSSLPLVKVLRRVDADDPPAMGFIYKAMEEARDQIKSNFSNVERQ